MGTFKISWKSSSEQDLKKNGDDFRKERNQGQAIIIKY
jgi:hypothetical protein